MKTGCPINSFHLKKKEQKPDFRGLASLRYGNEHLFAVLWEFPWTAHCLKLSTRLLIRDVLSILPTSGRWDQPRQWKRFDKLQATRFSSSQQSSSHNQTTPRACVFCYAAARRGAYTTAKKTVSTHFISDASVPFMVSHGGTTSQSVPSYVSAVHVTSSPSWGRDVCVGLATSVAWEMVACPTISSTASSITRVVELADPNCAIKTSSNVTWRASDHISPQSLETFAVDRSRWCASLSDRFSFPATNYTEKMEKRRAYRRQRRDGP